MNNLRDKTPIRRKSPKVVKKYSEYKPELKADYYSRCGYCNDSDHWTGGWRFYQLDHFVPKKHLVKIDISEYTNLIYSCFFCNNFKRAKWPTKDENVHNDGKIGFVHPGTPDYEGHLQRDPNGNIIAATDLGKYMIKSLNLGLKRHSLIWNLEKLEVIIDEVEVLFKKNEHKISQPLATKIAQLLFQYRKYSKLLRIEADA